MVMGADLGCLRCKDSKGTFMVETTAWEGEQKKAVD